MGKNTRSLQSRLRRHDRRRRSLLISHELASEPSFYEEQVDDQILLDPLLLESLNASASYLSQKVDGNSLRSAASGMIRHDVSGSALLADFPEVECEMAPEDGKKKLRPNEVAPDSIFDDAGAQPAIQISAEDVSRGVETAAEAQATFRETGAVSSNWNLNQYLDESFAGASAGLSKIRGWLHQPESRVWMFVGDETTAHLRFHQVPGYAEMFRHRIRWELRRFSDLIVNTGVKTISIEQLLKLSGQGLAQCRADAMFILPGRADASQAANDFHGYVDQLKSLVSLVRQRGTEPVLQTPPIRSAAKPDRSLLELLKLAEAIREVSTSEDVPMIDHAEFWQEQPVHQNWTDGTGNVLTAHGQQAMALLFLSELDLFDRSSQLCHRLQTAWEQQSSSVVRSATVPV